MAEGLGTAASVFAVIQITTAVASLGYEYLSSTRRAPECLKRLTGELKSLIEILTEIHICAQDHTSRVLQRLDDPLQHCLADMVKLQDKLRPGKSPGLWGNIRARLQWPFEESEIMDYLIRVERLKSTFKIAISLDQQFLTKTTIVRVDAINTHVQGIGGHIQTVDTNVQGVNTNVEKIKDDITDLKTAHNLSAQEADILQNEKQRSEILDWLYSEDFRATHDNISCRRKERTGDWVLETDEFCNWIEMNGPHRILWGYGIPGAGKTFLASRVIDYLEDKAPAAGYGVAHIYFNFKDQSRQEPIQVLASLVKQLACKTSHLPVLVTDMYKRFHHEKKRPGYEDLYGFLLSITGSSSFNQTIIVCDALDECDPNSQRSKLLPLLRRMGDDGISLFLTSREYPEDIQSYLTNKATKLRLLATDKDICNYIEQTIEESRRAKRLIGEGGYQDMIISELIKCAAGMFLLAHFHIEHLCRQPTTTKILQELKKFKLSSYSTEGKPLDQVYDRAMQHLRSQPQSCEDLAMKALFWVVGARRALSIQELRVAVSLETNSNSATIEDQDIPDVKTLIDVCTSFLIVDDNDMVRLVHYTVQEYLLENFIVPKRENLDLKLAALCTAFLSSDSLRNMPVSFHQPIFSLSNPHHPTQAQTSPGYLTELFIPYIRSYFVTHVRDCRDDQGLLTEPLLRFLGKGWEHVADLVWPMRKFSSDIRIAIDLRKSEVARCLLKKGQRTRPGTEAGSLLHLAVSSNCDVPMAQVLLENGADISALNSRGYNILHSAVLRGSVGIIQLLLKHGANISTPVWHTAISKGSVEVIRLLLEHDADILARTSNEEVYTILHTAVFRGSLEIIQLLLENSADTLVQSANRDAALHIAISKGSVEVVRLLLGNGADISAQDKNGDNALHIAVSQGSVEVIRLLLENGASISARSAGGNTALYMAVFKGSVEIIQLLLENGVDTSVQNADGNTALHIAAFRGSVEIIRLLLENGADTSVQNANGNIALHIAALRGSVEIIRLLLENGADTSVQNTNGNTALHIAAFEGSVEPIQLLLENGADISTLNADGETALHAIRGSVEATRLLLKNGADISAQGKNKNTALHIAVSTHSIEAISLLLENGADISAQNANGDTALHIATKLKHSVEVIQFLLENGADISAQNLNGDTALHIAAITGSVEVIQLLLENGADISARNADGDTALHTAVPLNSVEVIQLLLKNKADISARNANGNTALHTAASIYFIEFTALPLENRADTSTQSANGNNVLHIATKITYAMKATKLPPENGAGTLAQNANGNNMLHTTTEFRYSVEVIQLLLENGADISAQNADGDTALHIAAITGSVGVIRLLLENGADISAQNANGDTALHIATKLKHSVEVIQFLLENGADISTQNLNGDTAYTRTSTRE